MNQVHRPDESERYVGKVIELLTPTLERFAVQAAFARTEVPEPLDLASAVLETLEDLVQGKTKRRNEAEARIGGRTHATDTGTAIRAWLVFVTAASRLPVILALGDRPYAGPEAREVAHRSANAASRELLDRIRHLSDDQVVALIQQDDGRLGEAIVDRVLRYWSRPRLLGVDWLRCGPSRVATFISAIGQEVDYALSEGSNVMLAGDGFPDLHGTVSEVRSDGWVVDIQWNRSDD